MEVDANFQNLCRICTNNTNGISIYSKQGKEISLEEKIKKFLSIQVNEKDKLPKMVCLHCLNKLDHINKFATMAIDSQTKLIKCLNAEQSLSPLTDRSDKSESELEICKNSFDSSYKQEVKSSLLHAILTQGHVSSTSDDVTELEVTVDPMLFFEEEEDARDKADNTSTDSKECSSEKECKEEDQNSQTMELKPYQCTLCPRGFNSDLGLKSHFWNHLPSKKIFSDLQRIPTSLALSASLRHRRLYNAQCLCQECGRLYPTRSTLRAHQITHSTLRPHKCSLCDKTFKRNQDLKFHINQHTGERPYRCPYCPKAFASSGNCFSHRKRMHYKQLAKEKKIIRR